MANSQIIVFQLVQIAKNSSLLKKQIDKLENQIIDTGFQLIEDAGLDVDTIEQFVDLRALLKGEGVNINYAALTSPEVICSQPLTSPEQREQLTRKINEQKEKMEGVYITTNNIALQLEAIKTPIIKLQEAIQPTADTVSTIAQIILVLKQIPAPAAVPPGVGLPLSIFNTFSAILKNLDDTVLALAANLSLIPKALGGMVQMVNSVGNKIRRLPKLIEPFLKLLTMIQSIVDLQDQCPLVTQEQIDEIGNNITGDIKGNVAIFLDIEGGEDALEASLRPNANPGYYYKNFQFVLEYDPTSFFINENGKKIQRFSFPSRRIRCTRRNTIGFYQGAEGFADTSFFNINELTNPELPVGEYSYSSDLQVLVAQGKFAVDVFTNNITAFTKTEVDQFRSQTSDISVLTTYTDGTVKSLPNYIMYGGSVVNLNSSPTNVEYDPLSSLSTNGNNFVTVGEQNLGIEFGSYIQSGTLQVNSPVNISLQTFGGTGNMVPDATGSLVPRFTEALITFKRSAAIQDDINPFTGQINGLENLDYFKEKYDQNALDSVNLMNDLAKQVSDRLPPNSSLAEFGDPANLFNSTIQERLQYVFDTYYGIDQTIQGDRNAKTTGIVLDYIDKLYKAISPVVNNGKVLFASKLLFGGIGKTRFGNNAEELFAGVTTEAFENAVISIDSTSITPGKAAAKFNDLTLGDYYGEKEGQLKAQNWFFNANKAFNNAAVNNTWKGQAASLGMFLFALKQFRAKWNYLYSDSTSSGPYNNGAWEAPGFGIPLIPSNVGPDNEDVTIALQVLSIAAVNETINQAVGRLDILGTYTYNLEIIDSMPQIGGIETNFPTNYTRLIVEDIIPNTEPSIEVGSRSDNIANGTSPLSANPITTSVRGIPSGNTY